MLEERSGGDENAGAAAPPPPPPAAAAAKVPATETAQVRAVLAHITNVARAAGPASAAKPTPMRTRSAFKAPPAARAALPPPPAALPELPDLAPANLSGSFDAAPIDVVREAVEDAAAPPAEPQPAPAAVPAQVAEAAPAPAATPPAHAPLPPRPAALPAHAPLPLRAAPPAARKPVGRPPAPARAAPAPRRKPPPAAPQLTKPRSPRLRSSARAVSHAHAVAKSSEELEMERVEAGRRAAEALRARNKRTMARGGAPAPAAAPRAPPPKRPLTEAREPALRTAKRQRVHGMSTRSAAPAAAAGPGWGAAAPRAIAPRAAAAPPLRPRLTRARSPRFATTGRARASRFKPTEEAEAERAAAGRLANRARPLPARALGGAAPARHVPARAPTVPVGFSFATDARAAQRAHAAAAAAAEPFVFSAAGPVTRRRALVEATAPPPARAAAAPAPRAAAAFAPAAYAPAAYAQAFADAVPASAARLARVAFPPLIACTAWEAMPAPAPGARVRRASALVLGGGARRVLAPVECEGAPADSDAAGEGAAPAGEDGVQAMIRAGELTLHNPLFQAR
jgi:hypothetical protein